MRASNLPLGDSGFEKYSSEVAWVAGQIYSRSTKHKGCYCIIRLRRQGREVGNSGRVVCWATWHAVATTDSLLQILEERNTQRIAV